MKSKSLKQTLTIIAVVCAIGQGALYNGVIFNRWKADYAPKNGLSVGTGLDAQQYIFALSGFREMIAGILWVKADSFFDDGNYDAVLPLIRLVTLLDPKELDVYATGMWHIGYNFTDQDERSDRRYIPSALALGKEGIKNNPDTYEMYFETGWMWFNKIDDDYDQAVKYLQEASSKNDIEPARRNLLAQALIRDNKLDEALDLDSQLYDRAEELASSEGSYNNANNRDAVAGNWDNLIVRMAQRGDFAMKQGQKIYDAYPYDTKPPFDTQFSVKASVVEPRVLQIEGTYGVLSVGTRIRVDLRDSDYDADKAAELDWDGQSTVDLSPPKDRTFMQDQLYVKNRRFNKRIDMQQDPTMYPFVANNYVLEFFYNPRSAPEYIKDKFGFNGEGFTDSNFLNTTVRPGERCIYVKFNFTKDQLWRRGEWEDTVPTAQTKNFKEIAPTDSDKDVIFVPALRAGGK